MRGKKQALISGIDMGMAIDLNFIKDSHPILVQTEQEKKKKVEWDSKRASVDITVEVPSVKSPGIYASNLSPIVNKKRELVVLKSEAKAERTDLKTSTRSSEISAQEKIVEDFVIGNATTYESSPSKSNRKMGQKKIEDLERWNTADQNPQKKE